MRKPGGRFNGAKAGRSPEGRARMSAIGKTGIGGRLKQKLYGTQLTKEACQAGAAAQSLDAKSRGGQVACHIRFHLGKPNPKKCVICREEIKRVPDQYIEDEGM